LKLACNLLHRLAVISSASTRQVVLIGRMACPYEVDFRRPIEFNTARSIGRDLMKKLVLLMLVMVQPAWSQTRLVPKDLSKQRVDACAPIGRTEDGKLVYSMKCETLPTPPAAAAAPQAEVKDAPAPEPEQQTERTGLFGLSYDRRPKQ
jgi:hypothetical protein